MTVLERSNGSRLAQAVPPLWRLAGLALLLGFLSFATLRLNTSSWAGGGVTILWPTNGFLVGVLLCQPKRQWAVYVVLGAAIDFSVNWTLHPSSAIALYFTLCNTAEVLLAAWLLFPAIAARPDLTMRKQLIVFLGYGVFLAPALTAFLASFAQDDVFRWPTAHNFLLWFTADALGMAIVSPLCLAFNEKKPFRGRSRWELLGLLALLCGVTAAICTQSRFPFLFVMMPFLLFLGVRVGLAGSALGLLLISILGGISLTSQGGPMASVKSTTLTEREVIFQFFVAISMLMVYIVEVVIAESQHLQANLEESERRFRLLAEASSDIISLLDLGGVRHYVSPASIEMLGYRPEEIVGGDFRDLTHPDDMEGFKQLLDEIRGGSPPRAFQYRCRKADGNYVWLETTPRLYHDSDTGQPAGFVKVTRDVSLRKSEEERQQLAFQTVEHWASSDALTGIANRRHFDLVLDREWNRAARKQSFLSLLLIDIDHFKRYNDLNGHILGDECLRNVVAAMQSVVARPGDLLARYGGEEFVVILPDTDSTGARHVAEEIRRAVEAGQMPHLGNPPHDVITLSVGCATLIPRPEITCLSLLEASDHALYRAKATGRNRIYLAEGLQDFGSVLANV